MLMLNDNQTILGRMKILAYEASKNHVKAEMAFGWCKRALMLLRKRNAQMEQIEEAEKYLSEIGFVNNLMEVEG